MKATSLIVLLFLFLVSPGQPRSYSSANAHSHNDYMNDTPFYLAFRSGFGSIEADIFSINDTLFVAHSKQDIRHDRTLRNLYLAPLLHALDTGAQQNLQLLVDIKDDYKVSLPLLVKELKPLKKYLSTLHTKKYLTIVISGNRPSHSDFKVYPDFIFFDDDLKQSYNKKEWKRVALVSLPLTSITRWTGKDSLSAEDYKNVKHIIDSVHGAGKPIRFWAAPDTELSWKKQMEMRVDLIGTDKINDLADFLRRK